MKAQRLTLLALVLMAGLSVNAAETRQVTELGQDVQSRMIVDSLPRHLHVQATVDADPVQESVALPVQFELAKATLTAPGQAILRTVAAALNDPKLIASRFLLEGHTDTSGSDTANLDLSRRRAQAARDYLISIGVDADRLLSAGFGEMKLLAGVAATDARQRRVEIVRLP